MEQNQDNKVDKILLERFEEEIWNKVPHLENNEEGAKIVNATPLVDITADFKECAKRNLQTRSFKFRITSLW